MRTVLVCLLSIWCLCGCAIVPASGSRTELGRLARVGYRDGQAVWEEYTLTIVVEHPPMKAFSWTPPEGPITRCEESVVTISPIPPDQVAVALEMARTRSASTLLAALAERKPATQARYIEAVSRSGGAQKDVLDLVQQSLGIYKVGQDANLWQRPSSPVIK